MTDPVATLDAALTIAESATTRWHRMRHHDDVTQVARIAAWRAFDHGHRDPRVIYRSARSAAIDELRRLNGRHEHNREARRTISIDHQRWVQPADDEPPQLELSHLYGLTGRHAVIADRIGADEPRQDIAARLHVHPSRVSQLLAELRSAIEITNRPGGHP